MCCRKGRPAGFRRRCPICCDLAVRSITSPKGAHCALRQHVLHRRKLLRSWRHLARLVSRHQLAHQSRSFGAQWKIAKEINQWVVFLENLKYGSRPPKIEPCPPRAGGAPPTPPPPAAVTKSSCSTPSPL